MREDVQKTEDKIPLFGDIPIIGRLFRSSVEQHLKRNLVIFVSARLINPAGEPFHLERRRGRDRRDAPGARAAACLRCRSCRIEGVAGVVWVLRRVFRAGPGHHGRNRHRASRALSARCAHALPGGALRRGRRPRTSCWPAMPRPRGCARRLRPRGPRSATAGPTAGVCASSSFARAGAPPAARGDPASGHPRALAAPRRRRTASGTTGCLSISHFFMKPRRKATSTASSWSPARRRPSGAACASSAAARPRPDRKYHWRAASISG